MNRLLALWQSWVNYGISERTKEEEVLRIRLLNTTVVVGFCVVSVCTFGIYIPFGLTTLYLTSLPLLLAFVLSIVLIRIIPYPLVAHLVISIAILSLVISSIFFAPDAYNMVIYVPLLVLIVFLFTNTTARYYLATIFLIVSVEVAYRVFIQEDASLEIKYILSIIYPSIGVVALILSFFKKESNSLLQQVHENQHLLEEALKVDSLGSWEYDFESDNVLISEQFSLMFGFPLHTTKLTFEEFLKCINPLQHEALLQFKNNKLERMLHLEYELIEGVSKRFYRLKGKKILHNQQKPYKLLGILQDITERVVNEQQQREQDILYRSVVESTGFGVIIANSEGIIIESNEAFVKMLEYDRKEELIGKKIGTITGPNNLSGNVVKQKKLKTGELKSIYVFKQYIAKSGKLIDVQTNIVGRYNDEGKLIGYLATIYNLSQRINFEHRIASLLEEVKKSNVELKRSNQELEQFAYVASHDLQEPLRMVGNFVQLLEEEMGTRMNDEEKLYVNYIVDGVTRMSELIQDLLQYSRVGRADMKMVKIDPNKIIDKKLQDLALRIKETKTEIIMGEMPELITCEPNQLGIVFYNLINNAMKFNKSTVPQVAINCEENQNKYIFSIKDNGIGIDKKNYLQIFEIFNRLHRKEEYKGTGIGLALVKRIVLKHHGEIWVDSELGKGTTFFFSISKN